MSAPTQTQHPARATVRTVFAIVVALASLLPYIVAEADIGTMPGVAQVLAVAGAVTRILALPGVEAFLQEYLPWLSAQPRDPDA